MHEQNLSIVSNTAASEETRVKAIHELADDDAPEVTNALVAVLHDNDSGVRWAAGSVLAQKGQKALPALLRELAGTNNDQRLRQAAKHILTHNSSQEVRDESKALVKSLGGVTDSIAIMEAATELMIKLKIA